MAFKFILILGVAQFGCLAIPEPGLKVMNKVNIDLKDIFGCPAMHKHIETPIEEDTRYARNRTLDTLQYSSHGIHPANEHSRRLQCVYDTHLQQIENSINDSEALTEDRQLNWQNTSFAYDACGVDSNEIPCNYDQEYRTIDGTCNNLIHTRWGAAPQSFQRFIPAVLDTGCSSFRCCADGKPCPNPRKLSRALSNSQRGVTPKVTLMFAQWGQFIDHDLTLTPERETDGEINAKYTRQENIWSDSQCDNLGKVQGGLSYEVTVDYCIQKCDQTPGCTAFNYKTTQPTDCVLRKCGEPIPNPSVYNPSYKGYSQGADPVEETSTLKCCNMGLYKNSQSLGIDCIPINVTGDSFYEKDGIECLRFVRSMPALEGYSHGPEGMIWYASSCPLLMEIKGSLQLCRDTCSQNGDCTAFSFVSAGAHTRCKLLKCPIPIPEPTFNRGGGWIGYYKVTVPGPKWQPRPTPENINQLTAFLDGSMVYGSDAGVAHLVRTRNKGLLNSTRSPPVSTSLPPKGGNGSPHQCPVKSEDVCYLAGDVRIDELPPLTALHTTFIRLHNIIAEDLCGVNGQSWCQNDELVFQETRRIVIALIQQITYRDWLPHVVGQNLMTKYKLSTSTHGYSDTYDLNVDPTLRNVFSTAAFRFGHSLIANVIKTAGQNFQLPTNFLNFKLIEKKFTSPSSLLKGMARSTSEPRDGILVTGLTNHLFSNAPANDGIFYGLDLLAINIQRGRDHGIPGYTKWLSFCDIANITDFPELENLMPKELVDMFQQNYEDVSDIDLFPAGLAENPADDGILGPTFSCLIARQFAKIKHGDRFWYERPGKQTNPSERNPKPFTADQLSEIRTQFLPHILCRVTKPSQFKYQSNPFLVETEPGNHVQDCSAFPFMKFHHW